MELKGKIIDFLGDSITEGAGVSDIENFRYDNIIHRRFDLAAHYNYGIGGTRIAHQSVPSETPRYDLCFCGRAYMLQPNADLIVVMDNGRISAKGTHAELLAESEIYREVYEQQRNGGADDEEAN